MASYSPPAVLRFKEPMQSGQLYDSYFKSGQLKEFQGTTSHIEVAASGDLGYEVGINRLVLAGPQGDLLDVGKYLTIWKKIDGEWYVSAISFTSDADAPSPVSAR